MQKIKLFIASSKELETEREKFELFISRKNEDWFNRSISFQVVKWENFIEAMSRTRLQDEYNKAVKEADIFVMLFFTKVGQYTKEEFETAFREFKENSKPHVYTYFKDAPIHTGSLSEEVISLLEFKKRLKELGHFHSTYTNIDNLLLQFGNQLDKLFPYDPGMDNNVTKVRSTRELTTIPKPDEVIGRGKDITDLEKILGHSEKVVLMNGLGGIGKTTLAKQYVQLHKTGYDHIAWVDVKSRDSGDETDMTTTEAFAYNEVLIKNLGLSFSNESIPAKFRLIANALSNIPGKNLLVIDNAREDLNDREIKDILPARPHWQVLVTSRQRFTGFELFEVEHLTPEHAKELFKAHFQKVGEEGDIEELLKEVSYHTLTIELLAKTLAYPGQTISIKEVVTRLQSRQLASPTLQRKIELAHNKEETEIYIHLIQTFDLSALTKYEKWLMKQFAFLLPRQYKVSEIQNFLDINEEAEQKELQEALYSLDKKGWLKYTAEGYGIHRMVQQMVHYQLEPGLKDIEKLIEKLTELLRFDASTDFTKLFFLIPYAEGILNQLSTGDLTSNILGRFQNNLGIVVMQAGNYEEARDLLEKALKNDLANLGEQHPDVAIRRSNLANVYRNLGKYEKAKVLFEEALQSCLAYFEEQHPNVALSRSNLANIYRDLGEYEKARDLLEDALKSSLSNFGEQHPTTAVRRSNLANVYSDLGEYEKARDLFEITLKNSLVNFGEQHPNVAISRSNLANVYRDLGEYEKARDLLEEALKSDLANFEEQHPSIAVKRSHLANVYSDLGDYEKARNLLEEALKSDLANFGEQHPSVATRRSNLANVYTDLGEYEKARGLLEEALKSNLANFGEQHPTIANRFNNLAAVYAGMKDFEKAKDHFERAIDILLNTVGPDHPHTKSTLEGLAFVTKKMTE